MTTLLLNPHITISSPFGVADLPTLCVWRNRLHKLNGEPEEDLDAFMEEHLSREGGTTFAAYRDEELGGYFESIPGELIFNDTSSASVARIEMVFKREFFKARPENGNGRLVGGMDTTRPALNLVLRELFQDSDVELAFFALPRGKGPIQSLVSSVGAANVGAVEGELSLFVLSAFEWAKVNAGFVAEYEAAHPRDMEALNELQREAALFEQEAPIFAREDAE